MTDREPDEDVQQAQQFQQQLEQMKTWAVQRSAEYRLIAEYIEDEEVEGIEGDPDEIRQAADRIAKISQRITYA